jgi:hypothetical protein
MGHMNTVHSFPPLSLRFILILSSHLRLGLPSGLFSSGFHPFPLPTLFYRISPNPRPSVTFRNKIFLRSGVVSPLPSPQAGKPLVGCPRLLMQTGSRLLFHPQPDGAPCCDNMEKKMRRKKEVTWGEDKNKHDYYVIYPFLSSKKL